MSTQQHDDAIDLFNMLCDGDQTYETIQAEMHWSRGKIIKTVQVLRDLLAEEAEGYNVVCEPSGYLEPWNYRLCAGDGIVDQGESRWAANRLEDAERRLKTISHVVDAAVRGSDGRTILGRKARIYQLYIRRAEEDIAMMNGEAEVS